VLLTYPAPFTFFQSAEDWQAIDRMSFAMVGGSGPQALPQRDGREEAGEEVISDATFSLTGPPPPTAANVDAVRSALSEWGVTKIVMPDPTALPRYEVGLNPGAALGLFTVATGRAPTYEAGAWVWNDIGSLASPRTIGEESYTSCVSLGSLTRRALAQVPGCVLTASHPRA
jgi:hypothetical protein